MREELERELRARHARLQLRHGEAAARAPDHLDDFALLLSPNRLRLASGAQMNDRIARLAMTSSGGLDGVDEPLGEQRRERGGCAERGQSSRGDWLFSKSFDDLSFELGA